MTSSREPRHKSRSLVQSFNFAFEGVIEALRRERNMRVHFLIASVVIVAAVVLDVTRLELIALSLCISLVLITELVNTSVEAAVDLSTGEIHPLAKLAKDVAAGAVVVAAVNAVIVGYLVFSERVQGGTGRLLDRLSNSPPEITLVALVLTIVLVIGLKALSRSGTPLRGGWPSGHAALAFSGWAAVTLILDTDEHRFLVSSVAFLMAVLVAQTRIEAGVHTALEVASGALLGSVVTLVVFQALAT
ncbi:MAG: diacylglycerol kinase [Gaiella sp.]